MRPEPNWRGPRDDPRRRNGMPGGRGRPNDFRFPAPFGAMHYVAGLAQYRAGDYDKAADHLKRAADDRGWSSHDMVHPVLAMTHHRLGHAEDAKRSFEAASQAIERWTDGMAQQSVGTMPVPWFDWIESKVLYREAAILLTGFAPADDPKLREMERRALAAIQSEQTDEGVRE